MDRKRKISYYMGMGMAYGSLFGGLIATIFREHILIVFYAGILLGGLIGLAYGMRKTKEK